MKKKAPKKEKNYVHCFKYIISYECNSYEEAKKLMESIKKHQSNTVLAKTQGLYVKLSLNKEPSI
jgi:hypothetical protein